VEPRLIAAYLLIALLVLAGTGLLAWGRYNAPDRALARQRRKADDRRSAARSKAGD
jgi:hypothetical protein